MENPLWRRSGSQIWGEGGSKVPLQEHAKKKTEQRLEQGNRGKFPSLKLSKEYKEEDIDNIFSLEHINVNEISTRYGMIELQNVFDALHHIEAGMFSINEHTLDTTQKDLWNKIQETKRLVDPFSKLEAASCLEEKSDNYWKPGGTLIGISGR